MIRLPLRRICEKHGCTIEDIGVGEERIFCARGHRCDEWLIVDANDMCVGVGHSDESGEIFTEPIPIPKPEAASRGRCRNGHLDWVAVGKKGTLRCSTCYSAYQRRYRGRRKKERKK
jgi:hypothetical protein